MKTFTTLKNLATNLSNNTSTANDTLMGQLINDQHRYLIQKYFDNERSAQITTVGGASYTLTGSLASAAVSGTLTAVWAYPTCQQLTNFSNGNQRLVTFTYNSAAITWSVPLSGTATTAITTVGVQAYSIPANISKIKDDTINVGQLKYKPVFVQTRQEWDLINFLPYTSDIPNYCFIYNGKLEIFPIPSTTGNIITFNYKTRVADLSFSDYTTPGTITTMTAGSTAIVGGSTTWSATLGAPTSSDISYFNLMLRATPPKGDGIWYPILSIPTDTAITLVNPVVSTATTAASVTIGQMPLLSEDFHDMLVYGALMVYYTSIVKDTDSYEKFKDLYDQKLELLSDYAGTKAVSIDLEEQPQMVNPNLFIYGQS